MSFSKVLIRRNILADALISSSLLFFISNLAIAADSISIHDPKTGQFNQYDLSNNLSLVLVPNSRGSYDYYDPFGGFLGWSEVTTAGDLAFYDSDGILYRRVVVDYLGNYTAFDELDIAHTYDVQNYSGGTDAYDREGNETSSSTNHLYQQFIVKPDP